MESYVSVCPKCGRVYTHAYDKARICAEPSCPNVGTVFTGYTVEVWNTLSVDERARVYQEKGLNGLASKVNEVSAETYTEGKTGSEDSSTWISLLNTVTDLGIALGILGSVIGGISLFDVSAILGIAVIIVGIIVSLISNASIKVFLVVAKDIRFIRNRMNSANNKHVAD